MHRLLRVVLAPHRWRAIVADKVARGRARRILRADAAAMATRLRAAGRRGLFIDCGSNVGQGFAEFARQLDPSLYDYVMVEPNPNCREDLCAAAAEVGSRVEIIEAAASTRAGTASLYGLSETTAGARSLGASIVREHNSAAYIADSSAAVTVRTIRFSDLVAAKSSDYPIVVVKMDIEGAECDVLDDLIACGAHRAMHALYVEFHARYMTPPLRDQQAARETALVRRLRADGVLVRQWV